MTRIVRTAETLRSGTHRTGHYTMTADDLEQYVLVRFKRRTPTEVYDRDTGQQIAGVGKIDGRWHWWADVDIREERK